MPRGKKELAEQIIPYAASVEVGVGRGKTVAEAFKKISVMDLTLFVTAVPGIGASVPPKPLQVSCGAQ